MAALALVLGGYVISPWGEPLRSAVAAGVGSVTAGSRPSDPVYPAPVPSDPGSATPSGDGRSAGPTASTATPAPQASTVGIVAVTREAAVDPRAVDAAGMLDIYYSGINAKDFARATSVFDPAGVLNPADPAMVAKLARDDATSTISDVVLVRVTSGTGAVALKADATFQSTQDPGYGPRGRENETCTRWTLTYSLTQPAPAQYRILRAEGSSAPC